MDVAMVAETIMQQDTYILSMSITIYSGMPEMNSGRQKRMAEQYILVNKGKIYILADARNEYQDKTTFC